MINKNKICNVIVQFYERNRNETLAARSHALAFDLAAVFSYRKTAPSQTQIW